MEDVLITISREEYDYLIERDDWLTYLEQAGVANWEGYNFAIDIRDAE